MTKLLFCLLDRICECAGDLDYEIRRWIRSRRKSKPVCLCVWNDKSMRGRMFDHQKESCVTGYSLDWVIWQQDPNKPCPTHQANIYSGKYYNT